MRADRLLSIVWLLRAHERLSTAELAQRLEVSRRTIMRDIEALSTAGIPVYCERGPGGGVRLMPGYRTDVTALSSEESRALFAGVTTWGAESLGLGDALSSALRKLLAAVPDTHRVESTSIAARIVVDPQGWLPQPEREHVGATFRTIQDAVLTRQRLRMTYRHKSRSSAKTTVVDPQGLISAGRSWYLCSSRDAALMFTKLSRIDEAELLPTPCDPRRQVDVAAAWREQREQFIGKFVAVVATAWVRESRWSDAHEAAIRTTEMEPTSTPPPGEGWSFLQLEFVDHLHAMTFMLGLGPDARIETPESLRQDFTAYLTDTLRLILWC
ncbi:MAG: YafY family protein [Microlunatus sp.]